ncbi:MAG: efflux transporter periplasmic adaptor subunit [Planctomycetes bacterium]|nr:efflux transporter periplasmic adaptor subunit [Planctomycetota bacterium]
MLKNKKLWVLVGLIIIATAGALFWYSASTAEATTTQATFRVARGPLTISVIQSGTIQAREMTILQSQVEGRTTIIWLIPEGTRVKKGDLLVELDASSLVDERLDQEIRVQNAEAAFITAQENLEVVRNQAQSDVDLATLDYQFAKEDLQQYINGEYPNELMSAEANITLAQEELTRAQEQLRWSRRLFEEKFISQTELQADELSAKKRELDLQLAQNNYKLLTEFTYKRQLAQLESDVRQAEMTLERVKRKARADVVQAEADLKAKDLEYKRQKDRLEKLDTQIRNAKIYAPTDGTVIYATSAMTGGRRFNIEPLIEGREVREREELIYLPTTAYSKATVSIHEANLEKISVDLPAVITVDALPGRVYLGAVASIAPLPDPQAMWMNPDLKVYNTEVYLEDNDEALRTGMSCNVEIIVEQHDDALFVPIQSVIRVNGKPTVYVVNGRTIEPRQIKIGLDNNRMVHILEGLSEGEEVLLAPPLKAGAVDGSKDGVSSEKKDNINDRIKTILNNNNGKTVELLGAEPDNASTQETPEPGRRPNQMPNGAEITPEQREQLRRQFEQMTPEQRQQMRQRFEQNYGGPRQTPRSAGEGEAGQPQRRPQRPAETTTP